MGEDDGDVDICELLAVEGEPDVLTRREGGNVVAVGKIDEGADVVNGIG